MPQCDCKHWVRRWLAPTAREGPTRVTQTGPGCTRMASSIPDIFGCLVGGKVGVSCLPVLRLATVGRVMLGFVALVFHSGSRGLAVGKNHLHN